MTAGALKEKFQSLVEPVIGRSKAAEAMDIVLTGTGVSARTLATLFAG